MSRRELPFDPHKPEPAWIHRTPATEIEALLSTAPFMDPETATETLLPLREVLADAIDALEPREKWVFERCVIERQSIRSVAEDLSMSKSSVDRIKREAVENLRGLLEDNQEIRGFLHE